jgi:DNA-binding GntR family transcriptional regulator
MSARLVRLDTTPDLVERVYRTLVEAISDGSLAPGERLTQEDLADRLAVSRQPVLQALRLLKRDGLVHAAPGRGVQVAPLDATLIRQVYEVRGALDALAARLAAARRWHAPDELLARGRAAARAHDVAALIEADLAFHAAVYAAARNPLIEDSTRAHWCHIRRAMGAMLQHAGSRDGVWDEHEAIAHATAAGDAELAASLMNRHAQRASDTIAASLAAATARPEGDTA